MFARLGRAVVASWGLAGELRLRFGAELGPAARRGAPEPWQHGQPVPTAAASGSGPRMGQKCSDWPASSLQGRGMLRV